MGVMGVWAGTLMQIPDTDTNANLVFSDQPLPITGRERTRGTSYFVPPSAPQKPPQLLVMGCAALDVTTRTSDLSPGSTSSGTIDVTCGGVANNIAQAAANVLRGYNRRRGHTDETEAVRLVAPVMNDLPGDLLRLAVAETGLSTSGLFCAPSSGRGLTTPMVTLNLNDKNDLINGVASTRLVEKAFADDVVQEQVAAAGFSKAPSNDTALQTIVMDGNLSIAAMSTLLQWRRASQETRALIFEPTSTSKCTRLIEAIASFTDANVSTVIDVITPNLKELEHMVETASQLGLLQPGESFHSSTPQMTQVDVIRRAHMLCNLLVPLVPRILVTLGPLGVFSALRTTEGVFYKHHEVNADHAPKQVVSTTGAGDSLTGAICAYAAAEAQQSTRINAGERVISPILRNVRTLGEAVTIGQLASASSLEVPHAIERANMEARCGAMMSEYLSASKPTVN